MAKLYVNPNRKLGHLNPELQGHFSEHLGRCIYEGIYVGENSEIPNTNGMRNDVVEALKAPDVSLSEIDYVDRNEPEFEGGVEVVDVVWKEKETQNELHRYDPNGAELNDGDIVLVPAEDAAQKREIIRKAAVARGNHKVDPASVDSPLKRIIGVIRRKMQDAINSSLD